MVSAALALSVVFLPACEKERPRRSPPTVFPSLEPPPPVLECNFDLASRAGEAPGGDFQMCFAPAVGQPWRPPSPSPVPLADGGIVVVDAGAIGSDAGSDARAAPQSPCPDDMMLVDGMYCPKVRHTCNKGLEPGGVLAGQRCAEYGEPECKSPRERRRFCIDRDEFAVAGEDLPLVEQSWTMAKNTCESIDKRLCFGSEWEFACEGEEMRPYPYGYVRDSNLCNHDRKNLSHRGKLRDLRVAAGDRPNCLSPFGVRNLVGNVDEWAIRDGFIKPYRATMRGGWWLAGRNNCRAQTTAHDEVYFGAQSGFRCCKDAAF